MFPVTHLYDSKLIRICNIISGLNQTADTTVCEWFKTQTQTYQRKSIEQQRHQIYSPLQYGIFFMLSHQNKQNAILMAGIFNPPLVDAEKVHFIPWIHGNRWAADI